MAALVVDGPSNVKIIELSSSCLNKLSYKCVWFLKVWFGLAFMNCKVIITLDTCSSSLSLVSFKAFLLLFSFTLYMNCMVTVPYYDHANMTHSFNLTHAHFNPALNEVVGIP